MSLIDSIHQKRPELTKSQIEGILYLILEEENLTNNALIRKTGFPKETLRRFKSSISSLLKDPEGDEILFKRETAEKLKGLDLKPYRWSLVEYEDAVLERKLSTVRKKYDLEPKREYDQFFATAGTSISKVKVMQDRGDIHGKRIALVGDDDLLSVVLGLGGFDYSQVTVFDIDQDILDVIDKVIKEHKIKNIRTELYDVRKELRPELLGRYDVVVTDPPYTLSGVKLFLERALNLLGPKKDKSIYLYYGNSFKTPEKTLQIQELLSRYSLLVREKVNRFARYHGAESIGSASSLYSLKTTLSTKIPVEKKIKNIYTHQKPHSGDFPFVEHYIFKLYDVPQRLVSSKNYLQKILGKFCEYHKLKVVNTDVTRFAGGGYTFNYTLATSSLTVHTWPELSAIHVVLITCEPVKKNHRLYENLSTLFKTDKIEVDKIE